MELRLKLSRARKIALLTLFIFALLATALPVSATGYWRVNVLVAYDEEWQTIANNKYWYSPEYLARLLIYLVNYRFWTFNIQFYIMSFVSWDSDDAPANFNVMLNETIEDTGFQSGMTYGGYVVHVLVAFTGQDIPTAWGLAHPCGVVLVEHAYPSGVGQATDNILQHELSHLYDAEDHNVRGLDCVMNGAPYHIDFPYDYDVPTALVTENWCSDCYTTIMNHRDNWGYWCVGGGSGGMLRLYEW